MKVSSYPSLLALLTCLFCCKGAFGKSTRKTAMSRPPQRAAASSVPSPTDDHARHTAPPPSSPPPGTTAAKGQSTSNSTRSSGSIGDITASNMTTPRSNNTNTTRSNKAAGNRGKRKRIPTKSRSNATVLEDGSSRSSNNATSRSTALGSSDSKGPVPAPRPNVAAPPSGSNSTESMGSNSSSTSGIWPVPAPPSNMTEPKKVMNNTASNGSNSTGNKSKVAAPRPNATGPEGLRTNHTTSSTTGIGSNSSSTSSKWPVPVPAPPSNMTEPDKDRTGSNQTANSTGNKGTNSSNGNKSAVPAASSNATVSKGPGTSGNSEGNSTNGSSKRPTPAPHSNVTVISSNSSGTSNKGPAPAPPLNVTEPAKVGTGSNHTASNSTIVAGSNSLVSSGNSTRPTPRTNVTVPEGLRNSTTHTMSNATDIHSNRTNSSESGRIHSTFGPGSYHNGTNSTSTPSDRIDVREPVVIFQSNLDRVPITLKVFVPNVKQNQKNRSDQVPDRRLWRLWGRDKSEAPSAFPSMLPSRSHSLSPTRLPSLMPTALPTALPTTSPSEPPSTLPSALASESPSTAPSTSPSSLPSLAPTSQLEHHWGIQIVALPQHGTLYASSHSSETMVLNAVYPIPWSSAYDSDDDVAVFTVEYALNDTLYFNTPRIDAYGHDLPLASSNENITFCVVTWTTLTSSSNEHDVHDNYTVVDHSTTVIPIAVVHVNHGLPDVAVSDQELVVTAYNHSPIQILPNIQVTDHELDFNMNRVRVDVWTAQGAQLTLNDRYRHLADFDSCRHRHLAAAPQAAVWQCIGDGFMNAKLTFLAIPNDVSLILNMMRYLTPPPQSPFHDYSNSHDSVFIRLYDGVGGDCLTEAEHVAYMVEQNPEQARPEANWNHTTNATTTAYFGQCLMKEIVIKIRWNVTNPYGDDGDGGDGVVSRHSQTNSNASSNNRSFGDSWWEIVLGLTLLVLQFVALGICLCCCCEMLPMWLLNRQSKVATTTATSDATTDESLANDVATDSGLSVGTVSAGPDESVQHESTGTSPASLDVPV